MRGGDDDGDDDGGADSRGEVELFLVGAMVD